MFRLFAAFLLLAILAGCAGQKIEVRPRGEINMGFGVGSR